MVYHHALDWNDPQTIMGECRVQIKQTHRIDTSKKTIKKATSFLATASRKLQKLTTPTILLLNRQITTEVLKVLYNKPMTFRHFSESHYFRGSVSLVLGDFRGISERTCGQVRKVTFHIPAYDMVGGGHRIWRFCKAWLGPGGKLPFALCITYRKKQYCMSVLSTSVLKLYS